MPNGVAQSFLTLNYDGMLFNKGNIATPLLSAISGKAKTTNHVEFVTGQEYDTGTTASQPSISETASLTAPSPTYITRSQETNVTQIFQEAVGVSYGKMSNMGTLSGLNVANQSANPQTELDFQVAAKMQKIKNDIEYTFINGVYAKAANDSQANKTRGMVTAIKSNEIQMGGKPLGLWDVADMIKMIKEANAPIDGLVLWIDAVTRLQLNADASQNGLTIVENSRVVNGINLAKLTTPMGDIYLRDGMYLPSGTALVLDLNVIAPVVQPVPGKGNFFLEQLAKTGAGENYQLFGQIGLDHGPEWYHGKITGLATTYTKPAFSHSVYVVNGSGE